MQAAAVAILALTSLAAAADYPRSNGYVNDFAGRLSSVTRSNLQERLRLYEQETGREIAVVTVPSLDGESIETYSTGLFRAWGIGKRATNDGVLFLWAPQERKVRITIGSGLDRSVPHAVTQQIIEDVTARFRAQDFEGGVTLAVDEITSALDGTLPPRRTSHTVLWIVLSVFALLIGALVCLVRYVLRRSREYSGPSPATSYRSSSPDSDTYTPGLIASSYDPGSSSSSSSSSDSASFGGGDTSGGGSSGDY